MATKTAVILGLMALIIGLTVAIIDLIAVIIGLVNIRILASRKSAKSGHKKTRTRRVGCYCKYRIRLKINYNVVNKLMLGSVNTSK